MRNKNNLGYIFTTMNIILTTTQENPIYQIISLIITILGGIITILFTIYKWYKEANKDGKITKDEVDKLADDVGDEVKTLTDKVKKEDDKNGKV